MSSNASHEQLASKCAEDYRRMMLASLHRLQQAATRGLSASFTVTAQFHETKDEQLVVDLKPRERIPLEVVTHKLTRQLGLFEGEGDG